MNRLIINADLGTETISRYIYGHFAEHLGRCVYEGIWVGENSPIPNTRGIRNDVVAALRKIKPSVVRWPGGCFAEQYHWQDGIGPRQERPSSVNNHWGGVTETNQFGTPEFFDLCELLGADPYLCGNVSSGTVQEMEQWVEYVTLDTPSAMSNLRRRHGREAPWRLPFFGIGNEPWGCGGHMRAEYYADLYRRYQDFVRQYGKERIYKIACGGANDDYEWTEVLMRETTGVGSRQGVISGLSWHYYCRTPDHSATEFTEAEWSAQLSRAFYTEKLLTRHGAIMDRYDPQKRIGMIVDEWGTWYGVEPKWETWLGLEPGANPPILYQQNTMLDALVAAITLNIFHQHCDRVKMANIAQMVNVLQAMILTEGEKMLVTPTYHVFDLYHVHQDATLVPCHLEAAEYRHGTYAMPALSVSASRDAQGKVHISLCNVDPNQPAEVRAELRGHSVSSLTGRVLTAASMTAHNTFEAPKTVQPAALTDIRLEGQLCTVILPPMSVAVLEAQ